MQTNEKNITEKEKNKEAYKIINMIEINEERENVKTIMRKVYML